MTSSESLITPKHNLKGSRTEFIFQDHANIALKRVTVQLSPLSPEIAKLATPEKQKQLGQRRLSTASALNPIDLNIDQEKPSNHKSPVKDIIHDSDNLAKSTLGNNRYAQSS